MNYVITEFSIEWIKDSNLKTELEKIFQEVNTFYKNIYPTLDKLYQTNDPKEIADLLIPLFDNKLFL